MPDQWWTRKNHGPRRRGQGTYRRVWILVDGWDVGVYREWGEYAETNWGVEVETPQGILDIASLPPTEDPPTREQVAGAIREWLAGMAETGAKVLAELERTDGSD